MGHEPIVIYSMAFGGKNIKISQIVTIGTNEGHADENGDSVYIAPNSCFLKMSVLATI